MNPLLALVALFTLIVVATVIRSLRQPRRHYFDGRPLDDRQLRQVARETHHLPWRPERASGDLDRAKRAGTDSVAA